MRGTLVIWEESLRWMMRWWLCFTFCGMPGEADMMDEEKGCLARRVNETEWILHTRVEWCEEEICVSPTPQSYDRELSPF